MVPVLTAAEMREADRRTIEQIGLPGAVLMENAGAAVAAAVRARYPSARSVSVLCGRGNNGGDGFVVARRLRDLNPVAYLAGNAAEVKGDALTHLQAYQRSGGKVVELDEEQWAWASAQALQADVVVDALLGTGLREEPRGLVRAMVVSLATADPQRVVAVDLPSGLDSDSGHVPWDTGRAALTVTFAAPKYAHVLPPASGRVGELAVADIGIPQFVLRAHSRLGLLEAADAAAAYPQRKSAAHKGDFGHVMVFGGTVGKTGAAVLASTAALRGGAGLVTTAVPAAALGGLATGRAEAMSEGLPLDADGQLGAAALERVLALAEARDAVCAGPGLGQQPGTRELIRQFVRRCARPLVLDADGLNALAGSAEAAEDLEALHGRGVTVLTPHPGEAARLLGLKSHEVQMERLACARTLAERTRSVVVLKGERTIVAHPDGRAAVNPTGNPGLASGGTGDVLAGLVGALLARGCDGWLAATAGAYLHGLAGDLAARHHGQEAMLAGDVVDALGEAIDAVHEVGHSAR